MVRPGLRKRNITRRSTCRDEKKRYHRERGGGKALWERWPRRAWDGHGPARPPPPPEQVRDEGCRPCAQRWRRQGYMYMEMMAKGLSRIKGKVS